MPRGENKIREVFKMNAIKNLKDLKTKMSHLKGDMWYYGDMRLQISCVSADHNTQFLMGGQ
jgi:hypothetical protein